MSLHSSIGAANSHSVVGTFALDRRCFCVCIRRPLRQGSLWKRHYRVSAKSIAITSHVSRQLKAESAGQERTLILDKEAVSSSLSEELTRIGKHFESRQERELLSDAKTRIEVVGNDIDLEQEMLDMNTTSVRNKGKRLKPKALRVRLKDLRTLTMFMPNFNDARMPLESDASDFDEPVAISTDKGKMVDWDSHLTEQKYDLKEVNKSVAQTSNKVEGNSSECTVLVKEEDSWAFSQLSAGGQLVADFTSAWDGLAGRILPSSIPVSQAKKLLTALKLAVSALNRTSDGVQLMLAQSLSVAYTLADLQMVPVVMAAGLLYNVVEAGLLSIQVVRQQLGRDVSRLLHDSMRFKRTVDQMDLLDEENAQAVRQFCMSFHDIRSIIIVFSAHLHRLRRVHEFPRYEQHLLALEALNVLAPLSHAVGADKVSGELEDLAFKVILPESYGSLDQWFRSHWHDGSIVLEECKERLTNALEGDEELKSFIDGFTISARLKSRFSTMKKLLKDGRKPERVYDITGLRVVVNPLPGLDSLEDVEKGRQACYQVLKIAQTLWQEVPGRLKDYIMKPKPNGYESLHVAFYLDSSQFTMELQIRTSLMDSIANSGDASHSLYKGGMTDPVAVHQLKKIMVVVADQAAFSLKKLACDALLFSGKSEDDHVFLLFDQNNDGEISIDEFHQVMDELGANQRDAHEFLEFVDRNKDGSVSAKEFADFRKQARLLRGFEVFDKHVSNKVECKLSNVGDC